MPSGRQLSIDNYESVKALLVRCREEGDWSDVLLPDESGLNKSQISKILNIAPSVPYQNPSVKRLLKEEEEYLTGVGVIKQKSVAMVSDGVSKRASAKRVAQQDNRIKALEEQVSSLRAELTAAKQTMKKYEIIDKHLSETGRLLKL